MEMGLVELEEVFVNEEVKVVNEEVKVVNEEDISVVVNAEVEVYCVDDCVVVLENEGVITGDEIGKPEEIGRVIAVVVVLT